MATIKSVMPPISVTLTSHLKRRPRGIKIIASMGTLTPKILDNNMNDADKSIKPRINILIFAL